MRADHYHLVFAKLFRLLQFHHCAPVLILFPLCIQHLPIPLIYLCQNAGVGQFIEVQSIIAEGSGLVVALFLPHGPQVVPDS